MNPPEVAKATCSIRVPLALLLPLLLSVALPASTRADESRMTGRVVDSETLAPIAGAEVELANMNAGQGFFRARADGSGSFVLTGIASNRYYGLTVTAAGYADFILSAWQFPDPQRAVDVVIPLDRAGTLEVRATRADGKTPVASAKVSIRTERGERWWEGFRPPPAPVFTDAKGTARFVDVEAGSWTVTVESPDFLPSETRQVAIRRGQVTPISVALVRPASLAGALRLADGTPVAGVTVMARGPAEGVGTSDPDGVFSIEGLPPGRFRLEITQDGFEPLRDREAYSLREGESRGGVSLKVTPRQPELAIVLEREALVPGRPMRVGIRSFRVPLIDLTLFEVPTERLLDPTRNFRDLAQGADTTGLVAARRFRHVPGEGPPYTWREEQVALPEGIGTGAYLLVARSGGLERRAIFFVTNLGLLVKRSTTHALVSAAALENGQPVPGAAIYVVPAAGEPVPGSVLGRMAPGRMVPRGILPGKLAAGGSEWSEALRRASGQKGPNTDARGLLELPIQGAPLQARIVAVSASHGVSVAESPLAPVATQGQERLYLYTERPIYRPGQTVYWKLFARRALENGYTTLDTAKASAALIGPDGASQGIRSATLSPSGSADGSFALPSEAALGDWRIAATVGKSVTGATFAVQEYRKPEYRVVVTPDREVYVNGDEVRFVVGANYFFGAPVFGAAVRYNLFESKLEERGSDRDWADEEERARPGYGRVLKTGESRTDVDGRVALTFTPPRVAYDRRVTLEAEVVDAANRPVSGRGSTIMGRGLFTIQVKPQTMLVMAGQPIGAQVLTRDHLGKPVAAAVTVDLDQDAWNPLEHRYVRSTRALASATVTTDAQGKGFLRLSPSPARAGYLKILARAEDSKGNRITDESSVWVYDARVTDYAYRYPTLEAFLDRDRYQPGDTARILVNTDSKNAHVLATVEGRDLESVQTVTLAGNTGLIQVPVRAEYAPNVYVAIHVRRKNEVQSRTLELPVAGVRHDLAIRLEADRSEYRPGDSATMHIETRDGAGKPVRAELSVGVVDEAVYSLRADDTPDPHDIFYGKRPNWVTTAVSFPVLYYAGVDKGREQEVRKDFRDVALWAPVVLTDDQGRGAVSLRWPDNLTTWRVTSRGMTEATLVGQAVAKTLVSKPMVARLATPRIFIAGDAADLLSVVNNRARAPRLGVKESIEAGGFARTEGTTTRTRDLPAGGESRSAWRVQIARELKGDSTDAVLTFRARAKEDGDALRVKTPVLARAVPRRARGAGIAEKAGAAVAVVLPRDLVPSGSLVRIECSPSPGAMALSGVNFLCDYPYGCAEQTSNAVIAAVAMIEVGRRSGRSLPGWEGAEHRLRPYLERLVALQSPQGGWGWWREDDPDAYQTALALDALARAARAGLGTAAALNALRQGARSELFLLSHVRSRDGEAYVIAHLAPLLDLPEAKDVPELRERIGEIATTVYTTREQLGTAALALAVQAHARLGRGAEAKALLDLLRHRAISSTGETHWPPDLDAGWFGEEAENTGYALSALLAVAPSDDLAGTIVRWLAARRAGGFWRSTRTTGAVVLALAEYLVARPGEMRPEYRLRVQWNGETVLERAVSPGDVFGGGPLEVRLPGSKLRPGENRLTISREGTGSVYYAWQSRALVPSPGPDTAGEKRLAVTREYLRAERTTDRRGRPRYLTTPIGAVETFRVGDPILVRLRMRANQDLRWIMLEDPRPAGFEVGELMPAGAEWPYDMHAEQRDDGNVFFLEEVGKGETVIEYLVRPEVTGTFTALPATASGMYDPDLEVRSGEDRVTTGEK